MMHPHSHYAIPFVDMAVRELDCSAAGPFELVKLPVGILRRRRHVNHRR